MGPTAQEQSTAFGLPPLSLRFDDPELGVVVITAEGAVVAVNEVARRMGATVGSPVRPAVDPASADVGIGAVHAASTAPIPVLVRDAGPPVSALVVARAADGRTALRLLPVPAPSASRGRDVVSMVARQALDDADASGLVAVLLCDLDRFRLVNDSLGHDVGDLLLAQAAARLAGFFPPPHRVVPLGGDEFAVVCVGLADEDAARLMAERVRNGMTEPYQVAGRSMVVGMSVGVAVADTADTTPEELLRGAGTALHRAKKSGRARVAVADAALRASAAQRLDLESELRRALLHNEFTLHYQPEVSFRTGHVLSVEALVRWQHPRRGLLGPGGFVPVAEEIGLIGELGTWVLREACRQAARWSDGAAARATVRVNLSAVQLADPEVVTVVRDVLTVSGCPPERLCLEVTETMLLARPDEARARLADLRAIGVRIAIDDFGTGYSSLAYLKDLPVQLLKVDKSFVDGVVDGERDRAVVAAVVHLGLALGMEVTAEGVEHPEQVFTLQRLGVERGQGFLFARAVPADQVELLFGVDLLGALSGA